MNGAFVPPEILMLEPWWRNFFWNMATVQFDHRIVGWLLAIVVPLFCWRLFRTRAASTRARASVAGLLAMLAVQLGLGIATLVNVVPLPLAALHQAGALVVFALALSTAHALR
jgi:cytochrome c oxidase assembly protein subunit 15